jgi:DNA-binding MarR family transcriptional regulator
MHQIEIEQRLLIAQHNVSRLIDRLETEALCAASPAPLTAGAKSSGSSPPADRS